MSTSRAESAHSQYGRRRSNTAQSIARALAPPPPPPPPLEVGNSKILNAWVHEVKESPNTSFNHAHWPGVVEGDLVRITTADPNQGFLFLVPRDEGHRIQMQISIPRPIADALDIRTNDEVLVTKVEKTANSADHIELVFQDQYLGRNDMWRLGEHLVGQCVHTNQEITFIGGIIAKIQSIFILGKKVTSAVVTPATKAIYRSLSAKVTIFIQVCKELWEFSGDGERYYEKIVHSFLPDLFERWRKAGTNHTITIVLISRVFYEETEVDYAAGPLRRDDIGNWYKDFFKVITDLEINFEWKPTLVALKNSFWDFQRDILLTHHYHRAALDGKIGIPTDHVRLVGQLSCAQDGPILEALNLNLNPAETHYIDRSLSLTGAACILITPGTGYFRVSKQLLRLTTTRMLDQGLVLNLVLLTKQPLHQSPIFTFQGTEPTAKSDIDDPLINDALWCEDGEADQTKKKTFWWEPFWLSTTFWDKQKDLPFRQDRFVARAKMHEIQMLGLLEHDVLASIEVPFLGEKPSSPLMSGAPTYLTKEDAEKFDNDIFADKSSRPPGHGTYQTPLILAPGPSFARSEKRNSHRNSLTATRITTIEESPRRIIKDLPDEGPRTSSSLARPSVPRSGTSPSQSSIHSMRSEKSSASAKLTSIKNSAGQKSGLSSKLTPSWLFNPFRGGISEPQTSQVVVSGSPATTTPPQLHTQPGPSPPPAPAPAPPVPVNIPLTPSAPIKMPLPTPRGGMAPQAIKGTPGNRSSLRYDDDILAAPARSSFPRKSPISTPPREDILASKRRSGVSSALVQSFPSSSPGSYPNPSNPSHSQRPVSYLQSSMARRWQHVLPQALAKHDIKWNALVTPGCLPLTVDYFPSNSELDSSYDVSSWDIYVDPKEMKSFLVRPPQVKGTPDDLRGAFALVVMRGMVAVRLAQGFQFVLRSQLTGEGQQKAPLKRTTSFISEETVLPRAVGASDVLKSTDDPIFLSMTNEIHRISFNGEMIQVKRYVRRMGHNPLFKYQCLIWPKLGVGYTELSTKFESHGFENYQWNRLDMLVAGYEHHLHDSLRYWRTRFIVIPTTEPPELSVGPSGEALNEEEIRILGIEKLGEHFSKLRWQPPEEKAAYPAPPVRLLPTTLSPAMSVLDESLVEQLDQIHAMGPMRKKPKSERDISDLTLNQITKLMKEEDGVPIKHYIWHRAQYANAFIGADFVNWLLREFHDVSSRTQATEWGVKLFEQGLFEHCRGYHGFLDGHYYYRLKGEYSLPVTPNGKGWFRKNEWEPRGGGGYYPGNVPRPKTSAVRKKRLILSQTMVIDVDPFKRSDQAECVILHHDLIHNPATVFHFELQWIGTTARCIEDQLKIWDRTIGMYGLRLVEAYVMQIGDIRERNAFQSCFPIKMAMPPPVVPDLEKRLLPEGARAVRYFFEYALLQKFGFIVDVEAQDLYPDQVDVFYSYRRSPFHYSQFVHRSGVAFVQVLDGSQGFLFLTNRLMGSGRMGATMKKKGKLATTAAEEIRQNLNAFCQDPRKLNMFYDEQLALLPQATELEPPPLII